MSVNSTELIPTPSVLSGPIQIIRMPQAEMETLATKASRTKMFMESLTPEEGHLLMATAESEGKHPIQGLREYDLIKGKIAKKAQAMQADFQRAGGRIQWIERTSEAAEAEFHHPAGGTLRVRWTMKDAQVAGLTGKDNWRKHPRQMLGNRVISEGVRAILPGVSLGIYTPEEVNDSDDFGEGPKAISSAPQPEPVPSIEAARPLHRTTPEPPVEEEAPTTDAKPLVNLFGEQKRFFDGALVLKLPVGRDADPAKPDKDKCLSLFKAVSQFLKITLNPELPADWRTAHDNLPAYSEHLRHIQEKNQPSTNAEAQSLLSDDEDPFAESAPAGAAIAGNAIASGL